MICISLLYLLSQPSKNIISTAYLPSKRLVWEKKKKTCQSISFLGSSTTFFYMKSLAGIYVFCEVSRVRIPTTKQDVVQLASYLDDLFAISCLHSNISKESGKPTIKVPILPMACVEGKKKSILGKRRISVGSIAGSLNKRWMGHPRPLIFSVPPACCGSIS